MSIYRVVYYSRNTMPEQNMMAGFRDIHASAKKFNKANDLTGYLLFDKTWFVQIIEGDQKTVRACYRKIAKDPRHTGLVQLGVDEVLNRAFGDWSMGAMILTPDNHEILLRSGLNAPLDPLKLTMSRTIRLLTELKFAEQRKSMAAWSWKAKRVA